MLKESAAAVAVDLEPGLCYHHLIITFCEQNRKANYRKWGNVVIYIWQMFLSARLKVSTSAC